MTGDTFWLLRNILVEDCILLTIVISQSTFLFNFLSLYQVEDLTARQVYEKLLEAAQP